MTNIELEIDVITFEVIRHRLQYISHQMGATLEAVGGTVNTTQMRDYMAAIYTSDGRIIAVGESSGSHVACAAEAVKKMIAQYGDDIEPGDVFVLNDPYVAAFHQSDVYVLSPTFYEGRLAYWAGSFVHVMDIGAMSPGGESPGARSIYQEGLRIPGIKLVCAGELRSDLFNMILCASRQPGMMGLDIKCQLAAHEVVKRETISMLDEFGGTVVAEVAERLIQYSRTELGNRLMAMDDGIWRDQVVIEQPGLGRWQIVLALKKVGGTLQFDFSGTDKQAEIGINLPRPATKGVCFGGVLHGLAYDLPKNEGLLADIEVIGPDGTIVSAESPAPVSLNTTSGAAATRFVVDATLARMLGANREWREEFVPPVPGGRRLRTAGINQNGEFYASSLAQPALSGSSAKSSRDGGDSARGGFSIAPNVEWMEMKCPLLFLYRRYGCDGAGPGRFRGGAGAELAFTTYGVPHKLKGVAYGVVGAQSRGFMGGLPGRPSSIMLRTGTDVVNGLRQGKLLTESNEMGGDEQSLGYAEFEFGEGDVVYYSLSPGSGFGDPLERSLEDLAFDCAEGIISCSAANSTYGVVWDESLKIDVIATEEERERRRRLRLATPEIKDADLKLEWGSLTAQGIAVKNGEDVKCGQCGESLVAAPTHARWIATKENGEPMSDIEDAGASMLVCVCGGCGRAIDARWR